MSPNISASKSPLRNCVRSSRDGQFSSQPNTTERGTASLRYPINKQQQATNAEMIGLASFVQDLSTSGEGDLMLRLILSAWLHALDARVVSAFTRSCVI